MCDTINTTKGSEVQTMNETKLIDMVIKCIYVVARNEGLQSTSSIESAINWNYAEIKEIIDKYINESEV